MNEFKTGELVVLKSGSPPLTVDEIRGDGVVVVKFWSGVEFDRETFLPEMLIKTLLSKTDASGASHG